MGEEAAVSTIFPKWTNKLPPLILAGVLGGGSAVVGGVWYYATPKFWRVGYMPTQPGGGFSHAIHAGKLGMDCRYCHSHVEESPEANIPSVSTCIGCHADGHVSETFARPVNVQFVRDAWAKDESVEWRRIHKVPDYVRNFPHNVHINAGVSCFSCHGNIMEQQVVHQVEPLSMSWCLDCHRNPEPHLVPKDKVTDLYWVRNQFQSTGFLNTASAGNTAHGAIDTGTPGGAALLGELAKSELHLLPENCAACHY
jgi:hypothetical protein